MRTVWALSVHPYPYAPNLRFRLMQYESVLKEAGYNLRWGAFLSQQAYKRLYWQADAGIVYKACASLAGLARQGWAGLSAFTGLTHAQGVVVLREATPLGFTLVERLWAARLPMLLDFDDAIWLPAVSAANRPFAWLKNPRKLDTFLRLARVVTVCNDFLATYARQYAEEVHIIPTTIDTGAYQPRPKPPRDTVVIGWSGSLTTLEHFKRVEPALLLLKKKYGDRIRFKVIGAPHYHNSALGIQGLPWRAETEVAELQDMDIGLMPLPDDAWSRGKCALKALQYMALAIPPVVSPVGMNREVVQDGINGLWAATLEEWVDKLSYLIDNPDERARLGKAARHTVETTYSVHANAPRYLAAFQKAFG
uniref:Glycosyl transferase family 1 n=1 Tax=uncultured Bacteroidota bacterium TaxID=152509 RepID=H5SK50_9BACT|nr:glycosyl transferase family 1 [uncultured Bacteroidetes bacterium]